MGRKMRYLVLGCFTMIAACATSGPPGSGGFKAPEPGSNFGPEPSVEADAKAHFGMILKDPDSAQYRIGYVGHAHCNKGIAWGGDVVWQGYAANIYVNAKNSYGGYTGYQPYTLLWEPDGSIRKHIADDDFGNTPWASSGLCRWANGQLMMAQ